MANNYKILSIDESGKSSFQHPSKLFVLSAVLVSELLKTKLESRFRKLKSSYFQNEEIVFQRSYLRLLELFSIQLSKDQSMGKIIAESDASQDLYLIEAHSTLQTQNSTYRKSVTSVSLVNKSNQDPDVQIADALAPIAGMLLSKVKAKNSIERVKMRLIERKLLDQKNTSYLETLV